MPGRRGEHPLPVAAILAGVFLPPINHTGPPCCHARLWTQRDGPCQRARRQRGVRRAPAFSLAEPDAPHAQSAAVALRTLGGIDALIALQGVEDPVERRRRAVKHGRRALDALDELKFGLLAGTLDQATLLRLKSAAADLSDGSGDERLDHVLAEIDLRVAVELAKAGIS